MSLQIVILLPLVIFTDMGNIIYYITYEVQSFKQLGICKDKVKDWWLKIKYNYFILI